MTVHNWQTRGECRRNAPVIGHGGDYGQGGGFPTISENSWCGEFMRRPADPYDFG